MRAVPAALAIAYGAAAPAAGAAAPMSGAAPATGSAAAPVRWEAGVARAARYASSRAARSRSGSGRSGAFAGATSTAERESIAVLTLANPDHAYGKATLEQVFRRLASPLAP